MQMLHPFYNTGLKVGCIQSGNNSAKGVMRWDAIRHTQQLFQPLLFGASKFLDFDPVVRTANDCADSNHDEISQLVTHRAVDEWILQIRKLLNQRTAHYIRHESLLVW